MNNYWLNLIDPSVKTNGGVIIGDKFKQDKEASFEAVLEVIGFDSVGIPMVKYSQVKYSTDYKCSSKYGTWDMYKEGDIMCYIFDLNKLSKI